MEKKTKTLDEIKKGLEICKQGGNWYDTCGKGCPYADDEECAKALPVDALEHIQQLEAELEAVKRERDAAISEIGRDCETCKRYAACHSPVFCDECGYCGSNRYVCCTCEDLDKWEWRGVQENGGAEE